MPVVYDADENKTVAKSTAETVVQKHRRKDACEYSEVLRQEKPSNGVFSSFMVRPSGISVEIQDPEEEILLLVRRHFITNHKWILAAVAMLFVPLLFSFMPLFPAMPLQFRVMTGILWYTVIIAVVLEGFLNWYFDVFVITDERIIDIDFNNLIYKNITTTKIEHIEDVTYTVSGVIHSLFDFGNVLIQTAGSVVQMHPHGTTPTLEIWNTPHPATVSKLINELILEEEREKIEGRVR